jgi:hypothetical protein
LLGTKGYVVVVVVVVVVAQVRIESMEIARRLPNEMIRQRVTMEIDRILQNMPDCLVKVIVY